jgi:hypothetical protein
MSSVAPGEYTVAAIEQGWTLDWSRPEVIAPYLARGVKVTVASGARTMDLKDVVDALPLNLPPGKASDVGTANR